jgi:hypothetical protein
MRSTAYVVVLLVAALTCSACGTGSRATPVPTITSAATRPVVSASGTGSRTIGTYAVRGRLFVTTSCTGSGWLAVESLTPRANEGDGNFCPSRPGTGSLSSGQGDRRAQIKVHAPAHVHWTLVVRDSATSAS